MNENETPKDRIDRRDSFAVRRRSTTGEPDLVIRVREPDPARGSRWIHKPRVVPCGVLRGRER